MRSVFKAILVKSSVLVVAVMLHGCAAYSVKLKESIDKGDYKNATR